MWSGKLLNISMAVLKRTERLERYDAKAGNRFALRVIFHARDTV